MFRAMGNKLQKYCEYCAGMGNLGFRKWEWRSRAGNCRAVVGKDFVKRVSLELCRCKWGIDQTQGRRGGLKTEPWGTLRVILIGGNSRGMRV